MFDVAIEFLRAVVLCGILAFIIYADKSIQYGRRGYFFVKIGFLLVLFGAIMDITDNFESLNWTIVAGDTPVQAFLEKIVGYLAGIVLLAVGFWRWLPSLGKQEAIQAELEKSNRQLEQELTARKHELDRESIRSRVVEAELLLASDGYRALYHQAPIAIAHGIIGGSLVERNDAFARMLGYESAKDLAADAAAKNDRFHIWPFREDVDRMIAALKSQKRIRNFEGRLRRKDGKIIWCNFDFSTLEDRDGQNYYFYAFVKDITERKVESERLAESEKRLKIIMDSMPAGLFLVDAKTQQIVDVNVAMLAMTGYNREDLVGKHCCERLCPAEKGSCPILDEGVEIVCSERKIQMKEDGELPVIKTVTRVKLDGHDYLLEAVVDISEQKRLEHLKEEVDRIVAHDLKAPIVGVIHACKMLLMDSDSLDDDMREMLQILEGQGEKALRMIGMSLAIYKMEAGTLAYEPEELDFMEVVRNVSAGKGILAKTKGNTVTIVSANGEGDPDQSLMVQGDVALYESMLENLLANAIEASPEGAEVTIALDRCPDMSMSITNTGVVPQDVRDCFFEKYATSGKSAGTGLGTYSAKLVVDTVGGDIAVDTSDDTGTTTVTVKLPCA